MKEKKARRKSKDDEADKSNPRIWHPYRLQKLNTEKFTQAVNRILKGDELLTEFLTLDQIVKLSAGKESKD
ncbi:MAG: hypothetical protein AMJ90_07420 [candidate division Zixibacteria bacterium SM23_73_2]|nr:MAG: hypothetical protein AMJ90_07420 [candidate division Zixibacteria bacterium SM23_73_2]